MKKAPSLKAQRERLWLVCAFWVSACCGTLHNSDNDLCGTEIGCANRLYFNYKYCDDNINEENESLSHNDFHSDNCSESVKDKSDSIQITA